MNQIEIKEFPKTDYMPLVDYESWRVAVLAACDNTRPENILTMQKHEKTDEVFVLIRGEATLIVGEAYEKPGKLSFVTLEPHKTYTVKKGVWHNHVLSGDGIVLIVENSNTCDDNSPILPLSEKQKEELCRTLS